MGEVVGLYGTPSAEIIDHLNENKADVTKIIAVWTTEEDDGESLMRALSDMPATDVLWMKYWFNKIMDEVIEGAMQ